MYVHIHTAGYGVYGYNTIHFLKIKIMFDVTGEKQTCCNVFFKREWCSDRGEGDGRALGHMK